MISPPSTIAVTGATGFVGRHVVAELLRRGYAVRAHGRSVARQGAKAPQELLADGVTLVAGDLTDQRTQADLLDAADACIHLVGIIREASGGQTFSKIHVGLTRAVVDACQRRGVSRYVHMSALGARPDGRAAYQKTKHEAERAVAESGLDWTIFRPSLIHGLGSEFVEMAQELVSGSVPPYVFIPYFSRATVDDSVPAGALDFEPALIQPIWIGDVAACFVGALERDQSIGEIYNLVGPDTIDWSRMMELLRDALPDGDRALQPFHVPGEHGAIAARVAAAVGMGSMLPFDAGQALMAIEDSTADLLKVRADFDLEPAPFAPTLRSYAAQMASAGH